MPIGLQIFNPETGKVILDLTGNYCHFKGKFETGVANGSHAITTSAPDRVFFVVSLSSNGEFSPVVVFNPSTRTFSWTWRSGSRVNNTVIWGEF